MPRPSAEGRGIYWLLVETGESSTPDTLLLDASPVQARVISFDRPLGFD